MKKAVLIILCFFNFLFCVGQDSGVVIHKNLSWRQLLKKAKQEQKYILIDCNASWCGPCKFLEYKVFPLDTIGKIINPNFITASVQFDTTDKDTPKMREWYTTAHQFAKEYNIQSFPTQLVFDENGKILTKFCGIDTQKPILFINENITRSLDPDFQYFVLYNKYKAGDTSKNLLRNLSKVAVAAMEYDISKDVITAYLKKITDFNNKEDARFIVENTHTTADSTFKIIYNNAEKFDSLIGEPLASQYVREIIFHDLLYYKIFKGISNNKDIHTWLPEPQWDALSNVISEKYPTFTGQVLELAKCKFYEYEQQWDKYAETVNMLIATKPHKYTQDEIATFISNYDLYFKNNNSISTKTRDTYRILLKLHKIKAP